MRRIQENQIIYWNRYAETLYGWSAEDAVGRDIVEITPSDATREQANELMTRLRAGESWRGEFAVQHKDGTTFPVLVTDTPIVDEKGAQIGIIGVSMDISERKRAEQALHRYHQRIEILHSIDQKIVTGQPLQNIVELVAQSLIEATHYDAIRLTTFDPDDNTLGNLTNFPRVSVETQELWRRALETEEFPEALRSGETLYVEDVETWIACGRDLKTCC